MTKDVTIIGLDIGGVRTGVAISRPPVHIPRPLVTLPSEGIAASVAQIVKNEDATVVVVGLPRNLSGDATDQTRSTQQTAKVIQEALSVPVEFRDEAATSLKAKQELESRKKPYKKEDVDMLAATYILEDYIAEHPEIMHV